MEKQDWTKTPDEKELKQVIENIKSRGINVILVNNKSEALEKIKKIIPKGASIANGGSTTLEQIGFIDYLKNGSHDWKNLHEEVLQERDGEKQADLRRRMVTADYFFGSVNAISRNGELVACDATGSRVTAYPFAAKNLILVAGYQKIANNLEDAFKRVREHVFPLENERAKKAYGSGSTFGKWVVIEHEIFKGRTTLILVKEKLGF
jgi:NADPH:quinone reductase-like Zn-dependent oxidoreductase